MALYSYSGYDANGKKASGQVEASTEKAALNALRSQGVFAKEVQLQVRRASQSTSVFSLRYNRGLPLSDLAAAVRQLATLLSAGLSLDEALELLANQSQRPILAQALSQVRQSVLAGEPLHEAMQQHTRIFPPLLISMVDVGEKSGRLAATLAELADYLDSQARLRSRVQSSMAYPFLMAVVGCGVLAFLFTYVMPKIIQIVRGLDVDLPLPTRILLLLSDGASRFWWLGLGLLVLLIFAFWRYRQSDKGRFAIDNRLLKLPVFGSLATLELSARFSRTLATLLHAGLPLVQALSTCRAITPNVCYRQTLDHTITAVQQGEALALPLRQSGLFPPLMMQMIAIGEESGELEAMLLKVADSYENQFDLRINRYLSLLEPVMILLMGGIVGFVVLSILLPIFEVSQGLG